MAGIHDEITAFLSHAKEHVSICICKIFHSIEVQSIIFYCIQVQIIMLYTTLQGVNLTSFEDFINHIPDFPDPQEIPGLTPLEDLQKSSTNFYRKLCAKKVQKLTLFKNAHQYKIKPVADIVNDNFSEHIPDLPNESTKVQKLTLVKSAQGYRVKTVQHTATQSEQNRNTWHPIHTLVLGKRKYTCGYNQCLYIRATRAAVVAHYKKEHTNMSHFKCLCGYKTWNSDSWQQHQGNGCKYEAFQCKSCDFKCNLMSNLKSHISRIHA